MNAIPRPCICLVTNRTALAPDARTARDEVAALARFLDDAIDAGIDLIQIRERDLDARLLCELARGAMARAARTATQVVVNDRVDVALAAGASGVHLRADAPGIDEVRKLVGDRLTGRSVHSAADAAQHPGADYLLFGTVFETGSKPGRAAAGIEALAGAVRATRTPVLAIGGITPARARECRAAGAAGVAGIGLFLPPGRAPDALGPAAASAALRDALGDGW